MISTSINQFPNKIAVTIANDGTQIRKIELIEGNEYLVNPPNPLKLKHRGRKVIFKGIVEKDKSIPYARVLFLDTNRNGKVAVDDLDHPISSDLN